MHIFILKLGMTHTYVNENEGQSKALLIKIMYWTGHKTVDKILLSILVLFRVVV